jgi:hypothetical protein
MGATLTTTPINAKSIPRVGIPAALTAHSIVHVRTSLGARMGSDLHGDTSRRLPPPAHAIEELRGMLILAPIQHAGGIRGELREAIRVDRRRKRDYGIRIDIGERYTAPEDNGLRLFQGPRETCPRFSVALIGQRHCSDRPRPGPTPAERLSERCSLRPSR